ncbi:TonB-dependent receptor [Haliovirga abyssi]|uniref:Ligand-gated channel n=1 Tax=Haliovirga abyssi TaxID=2996794 RepID=A0AAU9DV16_9FUSO|nr:TonB-dependent receptor [Haliovirga abyssi]BDU51144.1 ligand-gated channel [Haliovirga abyssi]
MKRVLLVFVILSIMVFAEEYKLSDIAVTGERFENTISNSSKDIKIITESEIKESGASTVSEVLKDISGIVISDYTGSGKTVTVDLHGQGDNAKKNLLILVDGISINSIDMSGADINSVLLDNVERIEVLPGSGGVLYGDQAVSGVINIITKKSKKNGVSGDIGLNVGSYNAKKYSGKIGYKNEIMSINLGYNKKDLDGYRKNSKFNMENFKLNLSIMDKIGMSYKNYKDSYGMPGSLTKDEMEKDRADALYTDYSGSPVGRTENKDNGATKTKEYGLWEKFEIGNIKFENNSKYVEKKLITDMISWGTPKSTTDSKEIADNLKFRYIIGNLKSSYGVDYKFGENRADLNKVNKEKIGAYILNDLKLTDLLKIEGGLRREKNSLKYYNDSKKADEKAYYKTLYTAGMNFNYRPTGKLYLEYNTNYRTPLTDEYLTFGKYMKDLKPQSGNNLQLGVTDFIVDILYVDINAYKTEMKDEIYYNSSSYKNENMSGKTLRTGADIILEEDFSIFTLKEGYSYIKSEITDGAYKGKEVPGVPQHKFNLILTINPVENLKIRGNLNYIGKRYAINDLENKGDKVKSYKTLDINSSYKINNIEIFGGIKNILNEKYSSTIVYSPYLYGATDKMAYYPSAERNFDLGVRYKF